MSHPETFKQLRDLLTKLDAQLKTPKGNYMFYLSVAPGILQRPFVKGLGSAGLLRGGEWALAARVVIGSRCSR